MLRARLEELEEQVAELSPDPLLVKLLTEMIAIESLLQITEAMAMERN